MLGIDYRPIDYPDGVPDEVWEAVKVKTLEIKEFMEKYKLKCFRGYFPDIDASIECKKII